MTKSVKIGIAALAVVVAASAAALLLAPKEKGAVARVTQDGEVLYEIQLNEVPGPQTYHVNGENSYNTVLVQQGHVRMLEASCPDQVCVNQGWISDSTLPIVCLPNKVIIEIVGEEAQLDAVTK